ncbi:SRPBCC family protein [Streptomyces sp. NPDC052644]
MDRNAAADAAGSAATGADRHVLRFTVPLGHPEEAVWPAVASAAGLGSWLAAVEVLEPRLGGTVVLRGLDEPGGPAAAGTVTAWDVERVAEYTLDGDAGRLRFHLEPGEHGDRGATVLRVTHTFEGPVPLRRARAAAWPARFHHLAAAL